MQVVQSNRIWVKNSISFYFRSNQGIQLQLFVVAKDKQASLLHIMINTIYICIPVVEEKENMKREAEQHIQQLLNQQQQQQHLQVSSLIVDVIIFLTFINNTVGIFSNLLSN